MHFPHINWTWDVSAGQIISLITMLGGLYTGLYQVNRKSRERSEQLSAKIGKLSPAIPPDVMAKKGPGTARKQAEPMPFKPTE